MKKTKVKKEYEISPELKKIIKRVARRVAKKVAEDQKRPIDQRVFGYRREKK